MFHRLFDQRTWISSIFRSTASSKDKYFSTPIRLKLPDQDDKTNIPADSTENENELKKIRKELGIQLAIIGDEMEDFYKKINEEKRKATVTTTLMVGLLGFGCIVVTFILRKT